MRLLLPLLLGLACVNSLGAQELLPPPKESNVLPPPRLIPAPVVVYAAPVPLYPGVYRRSAYEHWQYLSPGSDGFMRPRVLLTPAGPIYAANGQPFLYFNLNPRINNGVPGTVP
jgi:hypothetical protein